MAGRSKTHALLLEKIVAGDRKGICAKRNRFVCDRRGTCREAGETDVGRLERVRWPGPGGGDPASAFPVLSIHRQGGIKWWSSKRATGGSLTKGIFNFHHASASEGIFIPHSEAGAVLLRLWSASMRTRYVLAGKPPVFHMETVLALLPVISSTPWLPPSAAKTSAMVSTCWWSI